MGARRKGRVLAFQSLYRYDMTGQSVAELLDFSWMDARAQGALTSEGRDLDQFIVRHLQNWDLQRLARVDLAILRVSVYALLSQPSIPASVTIDEAVDIAREYGGDSSYRFVNGVLDAVRKSHEGAPHPPEA